MAEYTYTREIVSGRYIGLLDLIIPREKEVRYQCTL